MTAFTTHFTDHLHIIQELATEIAKRCNEYNNERTNWGMDIEIDGELIVVEVNYFHWPNMYVVIDSVSFGDDGVMTKEELIRLEDLVEDELLDEY